MGRPITQEDLDFIETINFRNCLMIYKKIFFFILGVFIIRFLIKIY